MWATLIVLYQTLILIFEDLNLTYLIQKVYELWHKKESM